MFDPIPERLRFVNQEVASTQDEVMSILNTAIDNREEGIIIKHPDSVYKPDKRKDSGWFKIKPDYEQNIMSDLDLLIVGGYYGAGRRSKIISHFLLALADNALPGQDPRNFLTFVKVGSGYSDLELREILKKLNPHWKETKPQNVLCSNERPVVWVEPENSLVISVRAAEMIVSEKYKAGYTLRFPRMEALRDDKKFTSVMNMEEMDNLWKSFQGKLATGYSLGDATLSPSKKRTRVTRKINRPITVDDRFKSIDCSEVTKKSEIFADREICVMPIIVENGGISKSDLETMIVENGGKIVQNPTKDTFCVLTDKVSLRIRNAMRADKCDIVHYSWAQRCVTESQDMVAWRPEDMFYVCKQTRSLFAEQYGENFEEQFRA